MKIKKAEMYYKLNNQYRYTNCSNRMGNDLTLSLRGMQLFIKSNNLCNEHVSGLSIKLILTFIIFNSLLHIEHNSARYAKISLLK